MNQWVELFNYAAESCLKYMKKRVIKAEHELAIWVFALHKLHACSLISLATVTYLGKRG